MLTITDIKNDEEVKAIMYMSEKQIEALGFTEHSVRHSSIVSKWSGELLRGVGASEHRVALTEIAGFLHDMGNSINRDNHAQSGAILAYKILTRMGMPYKDAAEIMMAIGNHDETEGLPVSDITAALILADKADVHKSRVRKNITNVSMENMNIHDRVNLAAVFAAGGKPTADVPLGFVYVQKLPHLPIQRGIHARQTFRQIFMYGGF